jgi:3-dehydroquinate synthetase
MLTDKKAVNDSVYFVLVSKIGHTFFLEKKIDIQTTQLIKEVIKEVFDEILIG